MIITENIAVRYGFDNPNRISEKSNKSDKPFLCMEGKPGIEDIDAIPGIDVIDVRLGIDAFILFFLN
jgi:hypothetical protein